MTINNPGKLATEKPRLVYCLTNMLEVLSQDPLFLNNYGLRVTTPQQLSHVVIESYLELLEFLSVIVQELAAQGSSDDEDGRVAAALSSSHEKAKSRIEALFTGWRSCNNRHP
jgi:hypothetical protein